METMDMELQGEGEGERTESPSPPPPRLVRVKMEMEFPTNNLELTMEELQEDYIPAGDQDEDNDDEDNLDDFPPLLHPETPHLDMDMVMEDGLGVPIGAEDDYGNMSMELPHTQEGSIVGDEGNTWYQCKHCSILLEDVMTFLFHVRLHEDSAPHGPGDLGNDPPSLEKELSEAGVTIFSPLILTPRISADSEAQFTATLPPLPRLIRAPSSILTPSNEIPENPLLDEHLPRKCKLCYPILHFNRRQEFIDHLFQEHRLDKEFRCSKVGCSYRTRSVLFFQSHMENHPEPYSRVYICHICIPKTKYYQSTRYAQHMRVHLQRDGKYHCNHCSYATAGLQLLNKHTKKKHPETRPGHEYREEPSSTSPLSSITSARSPNKGRPLSSILEGTGVRKAKPQSQVGRQFLCYYCTKAWISRKQYESHMILRHRTPEGNYNCMKCNFVGDSIRLIARHFKFKHDGDQIRQGFAQAETTGSRLESIYNNGPNEGGEEDGEEDVDFELGNEFGDDYGLGGDEDPLSNQAQETLEYELPLPHGHSGKIGNASKTPLVLSSSPSLVPFGSSGSVIQSQSSSAEVKMELSCPLCQDLSLLSNHQNYFDHIFQTHCRDNAVYCPHCQFRATSLETTLQHITTAHPPRPPSPPPVPNHIQQPLTSTSTSKLNYFCRFCKSIWNEVGAYSVHMKQHLDVNGYYNCPYCHLPYPTLNRFNEHVKRSHEMNQQQPTATKSHYQSTNQNQSPSGPGKGPGQVKVTSGVVSRRFKSLAASRRRRVGASGYGKKSYACFYCDPNGVNFTCVKLYSRHMRSRHMSGDGLYACPACPTLLPTTLKKINEHLKRKTHPAVGKTGTPTPPNGSPIGNGEADVGLVTRKRVLPDRKQGQGPILAQLLTQNQTENQQTPIPNETETAVKTEGSETTINTIKKWFQCKGCFILVESKEKLIIHQRTVCPVNTQSHFPIRNGSGGAYEQAKPTRYEDERDYVREAEENRTMPHLSLQMPLHKCKLCLQDTWHRTLEKLNEHVKEAHPDGQPTSTAPGTSTTSIPHGNSSTLPRLSPRAKAKVPPVVASPPKAGRKMTCLFCFTVFTKQRAYIKHMKEEHADENGYFVCPKCPKYSSNLISRATKHIRRHTRPDKPPQRPPVGLKRRRKGKLRRVVRRNGKRVPVPIPNIVSTTPPGIRTIGGIQIKTEDTSN